MLESKKKEFYLKQLNFLKSQFPNLSEYSIEKSIEGLICTNSKHSLNEIIEWYENELKLNNTEEEIISLKKLKKWKFVNEESLVHDSGNFFKIIGIQIRNATSREVLESGWDQPILSEVDEVGGLLGLIRTKIDNLPHYLVEAKYEPGNFNKILLSPTLQATFSNINQAHKGRKPHYFEFFSDYKNTENYLFNNWLTEDGGRLYKKRNLGLVKYIPYEKIKLEEGFIFVSLHQVKELLSRYAIVNPHLARLIFL